MSDIENTVKSYRNALDSEDPVILQRLQIEVQLEMFRVMAYGLQGINDKLAQMQTKIDSIDWKLWETVKVLNPALATPDSKVDEPHPLEDEEFKVVDGKLVKR
jgi:uncharacterized protein (DUF2164 family)